jgi:hypothetical protein
MPFTNGIFLYYTTECARIKIKTPSKVCLSLSQGVLSEVLKHLCLKLNKGVSGLLASSNI